MSVSWTDALVSLQREERDVPPAQSTTSSDLSIVCTSQLFRLDWGAPLGDWGSRWRLTRVFASRNREGQTAGRVHIGSAISGSDARCGRRDDAETDADKGRA